MKNWRKHRANIIRIFRSDDVNYSMSTKVICIASDTFVKEEFDKLSVYCEDNKLWYFVDNNPSDDDESCYTVCIMVQEL